MNLSRPAESAARLDYDDILELQQAAISARITANRSVLLVGLPADFVASLPQAAAPGAQVLADLDAINAAGTLADGTVPLAVWLRNALALAATREETAVFRRALGRLSGVGGVKRAKTEPERARPSREGGSLRPAVVTIALGALLAAAVGVIKLLGSAQPRIPELQDASMPDVAAPQPEVEPSRSSAVGSVVPSSLRPSPASAATGPPANSANAPAASARAPMSPSSQPNPVEPGHLRVHAWEGTSVTVEGAGQSQSAVAAFARRNDHAVATFPLPPGEYRIRCVLPLTHETILTHARVDSEKETNVQNCLR